MNINIQIIPNSYEVEDNFPFCVGKISINDFWETFTMSLNDWTVEDYERQWQEGLTRLATHDTSCLVASVQNPYKTPSLINWWILYKIDNKIFIQNYLFTGATYRKKIGEKNFSPETCYDFIMPRVTILPDGDKPSEWTITYP